MQPTDTSPATNGATQHMHTNGDHGNHHEPPLSAPSRLIPPDPLTSRYSRQLLLPPLHGLAGQRLLSSSRVLLVGLGGLGCPAALYLAAAGVGTLGFVDADVVEESNLHRQILHAEDRVGMLKVESAREGVRAVNSAVEVRCWGERVGGRRVVEILEGGGGGDGRRDGEAEGKGRWDLVLDCSDNPATRYAVSDAAVLVGVPVVSGAAQRGEGQLMVLNWRWGEEKGGQKRGPCYRCVFPRPPDPEMVKGCSEIGVLGTAVGVVGVLMAQEAIKLLVNGGRVVDGGGREGKGEMLLFNAFGGGLKGMWRGVGLRGRRETCVSCGVEEVVRKSGGKKITRDEVLSGILDYETFCGKVEDVRVLRPDERVTAKQFLEVSHGQERVIDVREDIEIELGSRLPGTVNIPFSKIMRDAEEAFQGVEWQDEAETGKGDEKVYFVCHRGNDSQIAARRLKELDEQLGRKRGWIGDVQGGFLAMERLQSGSH
ncbi:uncharacterized protein HMPREF1541_06894 [Cyphellophora europaea CBS 101466]|uniref:Rhodanese domain-containing protein n=1 Tax=Cyphellophora europaea (strain CBS 101466) TaxID=1220924 RepID=W2RSY7_CYPE1|nr:uncharacterized protein HMPREF1541_06894 [Cyphellophora europaea CBS 101466]ETN38853.1 hypothetical protein HMPREF1541_06894 [Cyphellophora europaea CBS 101466]